jgi:AAA domain
MGAVIAFSGGCFSGKTSTLNQIHEMYPNHTVISDEVIRKESLFDFMSIEDIRKNNHLYLELQAKIIREKINQDLKLKKDNPGKVILLDRCLTDSLFYLTFYLDKSKLKFDEYELLQALIEEIKKSIAEIDYSKVLFFKPIMGDCYDAKYRPKNINQMKYIERDMINIFNEAFIHADKLEVIDLNLFELSKAIDICRGLI